MDSHRASGFMKSCCIRFVNFRVQHSLLAEQCLPLLFPCLVSLLFVGLLKILVTIAFTGHRTSASLFGRCVTLSFRARCAMAAQ